MTFELDDINSQVVIKWENQNKVGLSLDQQIHLLEKGILVVEQRALKTLSSIGLMVILDRVLHESIEKFDILCDAKINNGFSIEALLKSDKKLDLEKLIEGLRFFLIELLRVLGRLTAEILTKPLLNELQNVTFESKDNK